RVRPGAGDGVPGRPSGAAAVAGVAVAAAGGAGRVRGGRGPAADGTAGPIDLEGEGMTVNNPVCERLGAVHRRRRWRNVVRGALLALVLGTAACLVLAARGVRLAPLVLPAAAAAGAAAGAARRLSWRDTAALIDEREGLKGRAVAALEFSRRPDPGPFHRMQV